MFIRFVGPSISGQLKNVAYGGLNASAVALYYKFAEVSRVRPGGVEWGDDHPYASARNLCRSQTFHEMLA
jgi:hypothetical protein